MLETLDFIEGAVSKLVPVFSGRMEQLDKLAARGSIDISDFKLLQPAFVPVCDFLAIISDRDDMKGKIHTIITPAQFVECVNTVLYLIDLPRLWLNFSDALARMEGARENTKQAKKNSLAH